MMQLRASGAGGRPGAHAQLCVLYATAAHHNSAALAAQNAWRCTAVVIGCINLQQKDDHKAHVCLYVSSSAGSCSL